MPALGFGFAFGFGFEPHRTDGFRPALKTHTEAPQYSCCDEKSQCQALERTQSGLPLGIGHIRTKTHDYKRRGTITLFAALNYLEGKLITRTEAHHTYVEWLRFLRQIGREAPKSLQVHVIAGNYATHKHAKVKTWLAKHPRFHMHYTPTGSSWMNLVERFFADFTGDCIRGRQFSERSRAHRGD